MGEFTDEKIDSTEACFLRCKSMDGCSGVNVATEGRTKCQPVHEVPDAVFQPYDFDWFQDASFECYARPGEPSDWLLPSIFPTTAELYTGTAHPTEAPSLFPTVNPVEYDFEQWWDLHVVIVVSGIPSDFTCNDVKQRIWNAAMVIFVAKRVSADDIWVEGCNLRRRQLYDFPLQDTQHIPLHIRAHEHDIKNDVHLELASPNFGDFLQVNVHPLTVQEVSDPIVRVATHEIPEPVPLNEKWRMVLFLLFGVLAGTTCFACYLWLCVKRRAYRRLRTMIRRRQLARRRGRSSQRRPQESRRSSSSREQRQPPPLHQAEDPLDAHEPAHGGSVPSSEDEFEERGPASSAVSSDIELRVPDPTEAGDDADSDDANL